MQNDVASRRIKKGECPDCGQKTHKISLLKRKKEPITEPGKVIAGRCLLCNPLEGYMVRPFNATASKKNNGMNHHLVSDQRQRRQTMVVPESNVSRAQSRGREQSRGRAQSRGRERPSISDALGDFGRVNSMNLGINLEDSDDNSDTNDNDMQAVATPASSSDGRRRASVHMRAAVMAAPSSSPDQQHQRNQQKRNVRRGGSGRSAAMAAITDPIQNSETPNSSVSSADYQRRRGSMFPTSTQQRPRPNRIIQPKYSTSFDITSAGTNAYDSFLQK